MNCPMHERRRGSASILISLAVLIAVTATTAITMRGLATQRLNRQQEDSRRILHAAIDAAKNLSSETLQTGIRLPIDESSNHYVTVSLPFVDRAAGAMAANEERDGKIIQSIKKPFPKDQL